MCKLDLNQYGEKPLSPGPTGTLPEHGFPEGVFPLVLRFSRCPMASLPLDLGLAVPPPTPHPTSLGLGSDLFWPTGHRVRPECLQPALPQGCSLASRYGCTQDPSRPDAGPGLERCQVDSRNTAVYYSAKATWRAAHEPRLGFKISVQNIQRRGRNREP